MVQVLVVATWACENPVSNVRAGNHDGYHALLLTTEVEVSEFKPSMYPKPTKGTYFLIFELQTSVFQGKTCCLGCFLANRAGEK